MLFDDTYLTIKAPSEAIFRDRGSKFLAFLYPITSDTEIKGLLAILKAAHPKANHHCWAMRLGINRSMFRLNDDGEPPGTAGRPILNTLLSKDLTNILAVVVRYFGGTLLGVPGLINAYRSATEDALKQAIVIENTINDVYTVTFGYHLMNDIMRIIKEENLKIIHRNSGNGSSIQFSVRKTQVNVVIAKISKLKDARLTYNHTT